MNVPEFRKSHLEIGKIYFWTATINNWHKLLDADVLKNIIISSLEYLVNNKKIEVYAFVIIPNHIHLIWQMMEMNNKEMPHTSFLKYTAHAFKKHLQLNNPGLLNLYAVEAKNKSYEFWQRDSLAFELFKKQTIKQKIEYIHYNPTMQRWQLCKEPADYYYSSASFYESGDIRFKFLKHIGTAI